MCVSGLCFNAYCSSDIFTSAVLLSPSSAEFTTDLFPVLSMTKIADTGGGNTCFADILIPGQVRFSSVLYLFIFPLLMSRDFLLCILSNLNPLSGMGTLDLDR